MRLTYRLDANVDGSKEPRVSTQTVGLLSKAQIDRLPDLRERGAHNRFQLTPGSSHAEAHFYRQATERLVQAGFDVLQVNVNRQPPEASAALIRGRLMTFFAPAAGRWTP